MYFNLRFEDGPWLAACRIRDKPFAVSSVWALMELMELDKNTTGRISKKNPHDEYWSTKTAIQVTPKKEEKAFAILKPKNRKTFLCEILRGRREPAKVNADRHLIVYRSCPGAIFDPTASFSPCPLPTMPETNFVSTTEKVLYCLFKPSILKCFHQSSNIGFVFSKNGAKRVSG